MRLVVGLGNPGSRYAHTRHNVAWRVLDELAGRHAQAGDEAGASYRLRRVRAGEHEIGLLQPLTFMNLSGEALLEWNTRYAVVVDETLVVNDDVYLPLGAVRLRPGGSSGGHRGLESIEAVLGHRDFARLRIGVGAAEDAARLKEHVLEAFAPEELPALAGAVRLAADAVECWSSDGLVAAMNRFNRRVSKEVSES